MPDPLITAINALMFGIGEAAAETCEVFDPAKLERSARAISFSLKALQDVEAYNLQSMTQIDAEKYIRYEDLPPLHPDDRPRLRGDLFRLFHTVRTEPETTDRLSEPDGDTA